MKFTVEKKPLLKALAQVAPNVERRSTIPILKHLLIEVVGNKLKITSTDLDIEISVSINVNAEVDSSAVITIESHLFYDIVKKIPNGSLIKFELDEKGKFVKLNFGRSSFELNSIPSEKFPLIETPDFDCEFDMHGDDLHYMLKSTIFSASKEVSKYYLKGVYFHISPDNKLRCVATDGHRLAMCDMNTFIEGEFTGVILSEKTVNEILKIAPDNYIHVSICDKLVKFTTDDISITSKIIVGTFPNYERLIPHSSDIDITVDSSEIAASCERVLISKNKLNKLTMNISDNQLLIQANSEGVKSEDIIDIEYEGDEFEIIVSSKYLIEAMKRSFGQVVMQFRTPNDPITIREKDSNTLLFLIMPIGKN